MAATFKATRGLTGSAETLRRWVHEVGWVGKRANLVAQDDDPHRVERLARLRWGYAPWPRWAALVVADARAIPLRPKGGAAWRPPGTQVEVMTPGTHEPHDLAGALDLATGTLPHALGPRQTQGLFRDVVPTLEATYPAAPSQRLSVVGDHDQIHQAKAVAAWFAQHPRVRRLWVPTSGPRANPSERACGDGHALCTRHHPRQRVQDLVADGLEPLDVNGPWRYQLSDIDDDPAVTAAVARLVMEHTLAATG